MTIMLFKQALTYDQQVQCSQRKKKSNNQLIVNKWNGNRAIKRNGVNCGLGVRFLPNFH